MLQVLKSPRLAVLPLAGAILLTTFAFGEATPKTKDAENLRRMGQEAYQRGNFEAAVANLSAAGRLYEGGNRPDLAAKTLTELGAAYQFVGQLDLAESTLLHARKLAERMNDQEIVTWVDNNLGSLYVQLGKPEAETHLKSTLAHAEARSDMPAKTLVWNNLGNLYSSQGRDKDASVAYHQAETFAKQIDDKDVLPKVHLNLARQALKTGKSAEARPLLENVIARETSQPDSYQKIQRLLVAGELTNQLAAQLPDQKAVLLSRAEKLHLTALQSAEKLSDTRSISLASGMLGSLAEQSGKTEEALKLTRRARFLAQQAQAAFLMYRWEWQIGRLLKAKRQNPEAIGAYRRAIESYGNLSDCARGMLPGQSGANFQETVRPLYYGLADLLLQEAAAAKPGTEARQVQALLVEARETVEKLKSAELVDYFQDTCVSAGLAKVKDVDSVLTDEAAVYYIPLPDRMEILLGLPGGLQRFTSPVTANVLTAKVRRFRLHLQRSGSDQYLPYAQELYNLLIRPIAGTLEANNIKTLILIPDGALRTVPLAALHDGNQYLIEKHSVAVTPGLTLMDPRPLQQGAAQILIAGLSESVQGHDALGSVTNEIDSIEASFQTKTLLNDQFVKPQLQFQITDGNYRIIHVASHGKFTGKPDQTYLLTYDSKLTLNELEQLIRPSQFRGTPVEMLFLSACQTAAGDDRAALGLAGIAIKSGARSALASLWSVSDEATAQLVSNFYAELKRNPNGSKAEALRTAQLALLKDEKFESPMFWSPFQVIGNWY